MLVLFMKNMVYVYQFMDIYAIILSVYILLFGQAIATARRVGGFDH